PGRRIRAGFGCRERGDLAGDLLADGNRVLSHETRILQHEADVVVAKHVPAAFHRRETVAGPVNRVVLPVLPIDLVEAILIPFDQRIERLHLPTPPWRPDRFPSSGNAPARRPPYTYVSVSF